MRTLRGARHYNAGTEALSRNQGELAVGELERAATLVPHASEIQNHLGLAYWSEGRIVEARFAFEKAVELDCENAAAKSNLDRLDHSIGQGVEVVEAEGVDDSSDAASDYVSDDPSDKISTTPPTTRLTRMDDHDQR